MSYFLGASTIDLYLPTSHSLKDKRSVVKSLIARVRREFNVSVAEVDHLDLWQRATIVIAVVSGERAQIDRTFTALVNYIEDKCDCTIASVSTEVF